MSTATAAPPASRRARKDTTDASTTMFNRLAATCLTLFALIWLVPFLWALITSLRPNNEITSHPTRPWSENWNLDAYSSTLSNNPIGWWYVNSFIISTLAVVFTVVVCSMAGFALVHLKWRGKYVILSLILAGLMLPMEAIVLPQFMQFRALGLLGTYWALILPVVAAPVAVFVFHSFMKAIPEALIEAARLDGASELRIFRSIAFRLLVPGFVTVMIFAFVATWNNYFLPLIMLSEPKWYPLTVGIRELGTTGILVGSLLAIAPMILAFVLLQRYWRSGLGAGGVKA
jgi:multiple sugar transport system permease protein